MDTLKCDYKHLIKWIKHNPRVRSFTNFANDLGFSVQRVHYHIANETFMTKAIIDRAVEVYHFDEKQIDKFFYTSKLSK